MQIKVILALLTDLGYARSALHAYASNPAFTASLLNVYLSACTRIYDLTIILDSSELGSVKQRASSFFSADNLVTEALPRLYCYYK